jgi:hypothetical protein
MRFTCCHGLCVTTTVGAGVCVLVGACQKQWQTKKYRVNHVFVFSSSAATTAERDSTVL